MPCHIIACVIVNVVVIGFHTAEGLGRGRTLLLRVVDGVFGYITASGDLVWRHGQTVGLFFEWKFARGLIIIIRITKKGQQN